MGFLGRYVSKQDAMGCRNGKAATNKTYAANHGRVTQEQHVHQADFDQGRTA